MKRLRGHCGLLVVGGIWLLPFLPVAGNSEQAPPSSCQSLPQQGAANALSVYVTKVADVPGIVCVRAINGFNGEIPLPSSSLKLQKWEEEQFHNLKDMPAEGGMLGEVGVLLPAGESFDFHLPRFLTQAPPGRYRACLQFRPPGQNDFQDACSEEFSLP